MTKTKLRERVLAERILARRHLLNFTQSTHPAYEAGWVHRDICARLERFSRQVKERKSPRLMLLIPPRHGKSELASIRFPAWHLGQYPDHEFINAGYNLDLPMEFSRKIRNLMRTEQYTAIFPDTILSPESQSVESWNTTLGGGFIASGIGGGITGHGSHCLVIDDPVKNQADADSVDYRDKLWAWYQSTAYTRLAPGGGVLLIETWWNDDDLAGRIQQAAQLDELADRFEIVKYPAISDSYEYRDEETHELIRSDEPLNVSTLTFLRGKEECLHEDRYPLQALKRIRANLSPRIWSALYQQNPIPDEGLFFQKEGLRFLSRDEWPQITGRVCTAWDLAVGKDAQHDWTVGAAAFQTPNSSIFVPGLLRFKGDSYSIVEAILDEAARWESYGHVTGIEDGVQWKAIKPLLERRMQERRQYIVYEVLKPLSNKAVRAGPLQGIIQQGKLRFPLNEQAAWVSLAVHELLRFPGGVHDDIVDALAWVVRMLLAKSPPKVILPHVQKSWRDTLIQHLDGRMGSHMRA